MNNKHLLYLDAHQLTACRWRAGELASKAVFAANAEGLLLFVAYLAQHQRGVFSLLVNVAEEGFQIETIPFLRGSDRQAIIKRKLGQLFFNAALTTSLSLGYEKTRRKDERLLLAALTNQTFFAPWLDAIAKAGVALTGIHSLPLLAPILLRKLGIDGEPCLLLTIQDQSMRQSYFEKGELCFSRLTPLRNGSIDGIAQGFSSEAQKLQQYLVSQRLIARDQSITAHLLAHAGAFQAIEQSCSDSATIHYQLIDIADCAQRTGLRMTPPGSQCERLFLNLLASSPPRAQFADEAQLHGNHLRQIRSALYGAGAATLSGCLLLAGTLLFETRELNQQSAQLSSEASLVRSRYDEIVKTFPPIPTDHQTLRRVIDRYLALERHSATPDGLYREISRALADSPAVEVDRIDWQVGDIDAATPPNTGQAVATASGASEAAIVRGTLKLGANASARQLLAAFNVLIDSLKANPKLQVAVLQRPFDIEPAKSLKGGDLAVEDHQPRSFSLQLSRKIGS